VTKVYTLLSLQIIFTVIVAYVGYNNDTARRTFGNPVTLILVSVLMLAITFIMACCQDFYRRYVVPIFIIFTILFAIMIAVSIMAFDSNVIFMAVVATLAVTLALTAYACIYNPI